MITNAAAYHEANKSYPVADSHAPGSGPAGNVSGKPRIDEDFSSYVRFEIILYCLRKESMLINVDGIIQSISALYQTNEALKLHPVREFYYSCDEGLLLLPQNTPPQFVSEAYKAGVLCFYLPG